MYSGFFQVSLLKSLLYHAVDIGANFFEMGIDVLIWNTQNQKAPVFHQFRPHFILRQTMCRIMLTSVQLDHYTRFVTIEIRNIQIYNLLPKKSHRIMPKIVIPQVFFFFCHLSPEFFRICSQFRIVFSCQIHIDCLRPVSGAGPIPQSISVCGSRALTPIPQSRP